MNLYRSMYRMPERDADSAYRFQADSKYSMLAKITVADKAISRVAFLPVLIDKTATPQIVAPDGPEGQEVLDYVRSITEEAQLNGVFQVEGDEVVVSGT